ncbi:RING-H2 finger protein [Nymphaea thermarum]|nr:RING-H2 finger protein [Nymphaea thermarum]
MALSHLQASQVPPLLPAKEQVYASYSSGSSNTNFSILVIAIVGIVATAILLVSYYIFAIRCCLNWQYFSRRFRALRDLSSFSNPQNHHNHQPRVYAPENRGLEEYVIQSIPVFNFKRKDCFLCEDSYECAVCLNQFEEGEKLRILPKCSHAFHIDCVDTWLQTHSNCPICRARVSNTVLCHQYLIEIENPFTEGRQNLHSDGQNGLSRENSSQSQPTENSDVQAGQEGQCAIVQVGGNASPNKMMESGFFEVKFTNRKSTVERMKMRHHHHSSIGDECIDVRKRDDQQLYISLAEILAQNPHLRAVGSEEGCSNSSSGRARRMFFPFSHGRGMSRNAILPVRVEPRLP